MTHPDLARRVASEQQADLRRLAQISHLGHGRTARSRGGWPFRLVAWLRRGQLAVPTRVCVDC